ncbi:hypothetical protein QN277_002108 [Acacia crassicarpa]|uniref:Cysteine-rich transmembrane domain-containing protein n=1 Tax=Acacia crassicarpa TaxID=499986 RepID=A0AAE1THI4_9FABA|nr:hypothetical protein QN277_002108 [Acacia crassicarpa]
MENERTIAAIGEHQNQSDRRNKCCPYVKKKEKRGFLEGCLFALCCCWLCEVCCDVTVA